MKIKKINPLLLLLFVSCSTTIQTSKVERTNASVDDASCGDIVQVILKSENSSLQKNTMPLKVRAVDKLNVEVTDTVGNSRIPVLLNKRDASDLIVTYRGKNIKLSELKLEGSVYDIQLTNGKFQELYHSISIQDGKKEFIEKNLLRYERGDFKDKDLAPDGFSIRFFKDVNRAASEDEVRSALDYEFRKQWKFVDYETGFYNVSEHLRGNTGTLFKLNAVGELAHIDFGSLPQGIYKLMINVNNKDGTRSTEEILMSVQMSMPLRVRAVDKLNAEVTDTISKSRIPVLLNNRDASDLIVTYRGKNIKLSELKLKGSVHDIQLENSKFQQLYHSVSIQDGKKEFMEENLLRYRRGDFKDVDLAPDWFSIRFFKDVNSATNEDEVRSALDYEFRKQWKFVDYETGFYNVSDRLHGNTGTFFKLNAIGELIHVDFGSLPQGLYKLMINVNNKDGTRSTEEILMSVQM